MVRPASVMMLSVRLSAQEKRRAASTEVGKETAVTSVARSERRKAKITSIASTAPTSASSTSPFTDSSTSVAELSTTTT